MSARKSKKRTVTPKKKAKRRQKLKYTCVHMQVTAQKYVFDELNEHGAMNDVHKTVPCYEMQFSYSHPRVTRNEVPRIVESVFIFKTTDKAVYDAYMVGQEYDKLPE